MPKKDDLQELIAPLERRLQRRKEQAAVYGINTPPEISIEIEDLEAKIEQLKAELAALAAKEEATPAESPPDEPLDVTESDPQTVPAIQPGAGIELTPPIESVLRHMFAGYDRLYVETEFGQGLTNTRVFKVRPIGGRDYLPLVVKVGSEQLIQREWEAYKQAEVADTMASIARLEQPPTVLTGSDWAGLRYTLAGDAVHEVVSLKQYCQATDQLRLAGDLERFLKRMSKRWWLHHHTAHRQFRAEYDQLLPINLMIKPLPERPDEEIHQLRADRILPAKVSSGEAVHLQGFVVTEVEAKAQQIEVTLNLPAAADDPPQDSYRLRLVNGPALERYQEGEVVDSLYGRVVTTRQAMLTRLAAAAMSDALDLTAVRLRLAIESKDTYPVHLPNPLLAYETILYSFIKLKISTIHGDLNLENVLVDASNGEMYLIDFAATRQGHALHDLLHLEQGVVTQLIPPVIEDANLPAETIWLIYQQLHQVMVQHDFKPQLPDPALKKPFAILTAIRQSARGCLAEPDNWEEYYQGLILYLLTALKFKDLDKLPTAPRPKQVAFWGAATAITLINERPLGPEAEGSESRLEPDPETEPSSIATQLLTPETDKSDLPKTIDPVKPPPENDKFLPPINVTRRIEINQTTFNEINQRTVFKNLKPRRVGEIHIIPLLPNRRGEISVFGARGKPRTATIRLEATGAISVQPWSQRSKEFKATASQNIEDWPGPKHTWQFERLNLTQKFILNDDIEMSFDRNVIKAAWWIWHKAQNQTKQRYLILLGENTQL